MSAALALGDALVEALRAHAPTQSFLKATSTDRRIYSGRAPNPDTERYIVVGESVERMGGGGSVFGAAGYAGTERLHLWVKGVAKRPVLELYGHVEAALSQPIALDAHTLLLLRVSLVRTMLDQDGQYHHGVAEVRAETRRT